MQLDYWYLCLPTQILSSNLPFPSHSHSLHTLYPFPFSTYPPPFPPSLLSKSPPSTNSTRLYDLKLPYLSFTPHHSPSQYPHPLLFLFLHPPPPSTPHPSLIHFICS